MNERNLERIDEFLMTMEKALGRSGRQSKEILSEVRTDLLAHFARYRTEGCDEDTAVKRALDEMGNPYELAHHMRWEVPPFSGDLLTALRYFAAIAVCIWLLVLSWNLRASAYSVFGVTVTVGILLLHLPVILLLWPRIVWRANWLFGMIPVGLVLVFAFFLNTGGVSIETSAVRISHSEQGIAALNQSDTDAEFVPYDSRPNPIIPILVFSSAAIATVVLFLAMQRQSQRRVTLCAVVLAFVLIEGPFQVEEFLFRREREQVRVELKQKASSVDNDPRTAESRRMRFDRARVSVNGKEFSLTWPRPLCSGFSIQYSSEDDRVVIQD